MRQKFKAIAEAIAKDCNKSNQDIADDIGMTPANYSNAKATKDNLSLFIDICESCDADLSLYVKKDERQILEMDAIKRINNDIEEHSRSKNSAIAVERTASEMFGNQALFRVISKTGKTYFFELINNK